VPAVASVACTTVTPVHGAASASTLPARRTTSTPPFTGSMDPPDGPRPYVRS